MKGKYNLALRLVCLILTLFSISSVTIAQQTASSGLDKKAFNFGIGASSWGVPVFAELELPLNIDDNISLALGASYQSRKESYNNYYFTYDVTWKHTITGLHISGRYYLDEWFSDIMPDQIDAFGGLNLSYYSWRTKLIDSANGFNENYNGTGNGGIRITAQAGGRYHFKEDGKWSLFVLFNGTSLLSSANIGLSCQF